MNRHTFGGGKLLFTVALVTALGTLAFPQNTSAAVFIGGDQFASDGPWSIGVDPEFGDGMFSWEVEIAPEIFVNHMFQQWFWFRDNTAGDPFESRLDDLTLLSADTPDPNRIVLEYGDSLNGDPINVVVEYILDGPSTTSSTITETVTITNISGSDLDLTWFEYTDLDLDQSFPNDVGQRTSNSSLRQISELGSTVDVNVLSGPTPDKFEISEFPDLVDSLDDLDVTELSNASVSLGPTDVVNAFQWDLNLGTDSIAGNDKVTIVKEKTGTFAEIVFPDSINGGFNFFDPDPPQRGETPRWYDPVVAIGYDYVVNPGGANFAEVILPGGFTDGLYELEVLDPTHPSFGLGPFSVTGDGSSVSFDFTLGGTHAAGASAFRVLGIEPAAGIDPSDPLGFPTGLTFVGSPADFTQTAIATPEPTSLVLLSVGMMGLAGLHLRRRRSRPSVSEAA